MHVSSDFDSAPFAARRTAFFGAFDGPAIVDAGRECPRNYAANTFPFRASSHFLYLVGLPIEGACLVRADDVAIYAPAKSKDDALWHGPTPSFEELGERLGLPVRSLGQMPDLGGAAGVLFAPGSISRSQMCLRLGRNSHGPTERDRVIRRAIIGCRSRHDAHAISELEQAAEATVEAHRAGMAITRPGVHEREIRAAMEYALHRRGMGTSYEPIVTIRGEVLHNRGQTAVTKAGDLLLADVGAETEAGFAGDVTRTWPVSGAFSSTQREVYDAVLASHTAAVARCVAGTRYRDVHLEACRVLASGLVDLGILRGDPDELVADGVHALFFPHGVGHLIGLDVHDMEDLGDEAGYAPDRTRSAQFGLGYLRLDRDLQSGMAVTIEPGFYRVPAILENPELRAIGGDRVNHERLAAFADVRGIRIEDDVLITEDAPRGLTDGLARSAYDVESLVDA